MPNHSDNNKRLAKNTIVLYIRTIVLMLVSLYTSRVVLDVLGVDDYGIYNVVGGAIAMFSVVSGSISNAISRFITFELGKGDLKKLKEVFVSSVNIQIGISVIVFLLGETFGLWFLNTYMNIPVERLPAANWVLHCSLLAFVINLLSLPYNSCIIAHEHMTAFAYIGILDAALRLIVVLILPIFSVDKLMIYSVLIVLAALLVRIVYTIYCKLHFPECEYYLSYNKSLICEMAGFSGWQFLTNTCWIVNTQGINVLSNIFFGVRINAARGVAAQVEGAVMTFVNNFMTAINPQLVKSYAQHDTERFFSLICRGAKFSYFMLLLIALPIIMETEFILGIWLKQVPDFSVLFVRLSIIAAIMNMLGNTGVAACMATGDLKRYSIIISAVGYTVFPITWITFYLGMPAESAYVIFIIIYLLIIFVRLYVMKGLLNFPPMMYIRKVLLVIMPVSLVAVILPYLSLYVMDDSLIRFLIVTMLCVVSTSVAAYLIGLTSNEKKFFVSYILKKFSSHGV